MTDQVQPRSGSAGRRRKRSVFRSVLAIAVAALIAAWLPFSVIYVNAVTKHAIVTAKAGAQLQANARTHNASSPIPVTTRVS